MKKHSYFKIFILLAFIISGCGPTGTNTPDTTLNPTPNIPAPQGDYGDAPDSEASGYPSLFAQTGKFPTLFASNGARTLDVGQAVLGESASLELDAIDPNDPDGSQNLTNSDSDDGLTNFFIHLVSIPPPTTMTVNVTAPENSDGGTFYLNAIIDLNMDGVWGGFGGNGESEWVVQNQAVQLSAGQSMPFTPPDFAYSNGNLLPDDTYMRLALTKEQVPANWDGTGEFSAGEIEDHVIHLPEIGGKKNPILQVDCGGPYQPGAVVTCIVTNMRPVAGSFTYSLRHIGTGTVNVPLATCNALVGVHPGGPVPINANGVVVINCNSTPGIAPDTWRFITRVPDPDAVIVSDGINAGHTEESTADFNFEGDPKTMSAFVGAFGSRVQHFGSFSCIFVDYYVYADDPIPVENADVTLMLTLPDGSTFTQTVQSGANGKGTAEFTIFSYGDYSVEVLDIVGENIVYDPTMNEISTFDLTVSSSEGYVFGPEGYMPPTVSYDVASFIEEFNTAFAEKQIFGLLKLLDINVFELYGEDTCTAYLESVIENTISVQAQDVLSFGMWDWEVDDRIISMDNIYTVRINVILGDQITEQLTHYGQLENGLLTWFTDCGDPLP